MFDEIPIEDQIILRQKEERTCKNRDKCENSRFEEKRERKEAIDNGRSGKKRD